MSIGQTERGASRRLRVVHCVGFYFPQNVGGTEVYVRDLVAALSSEAIDNRIVAATDRAYEEYVWAGMPILRYPSNWADSPGNADSGEAGESKFQELIARLKPDIFHLHSWTTGAGLKHLSQAAALGIRCIVTMHVASALCIRGTMLLEGAVACDGRIEAPRCTRCWALARGLPRPLAVAISHVPAVPLPENVSRRLGRVGTVLSARDRVMAQATDLQRMAALSRRVIAPSQWVQAALAANGVPHEKIQVSRQAVAEPFVELARRSPERAKRGALRVGFVGRLEWYKGPHILLEAMSRISPDVPLRLLIAGGGTEPPYLRLLEAAANGDARIEFLGPFSPSDLPSFLEQIDVLAVPSNCMETGPLVVLEAQAFGIPVMGADLGGISERVMDGVDGWLLPFRDSNAWANAMREAALDPDLVARLRANVKVSRTMATVAAEMTALYREVDAEGVAGNQHERYGESGRPR